MIEMRGKKKTFRINGGESKRCPGKARRNAQREAWTVPGPDVHERNALTKKKSRDERTLIIRLALYTSLVTENKPIEDEAEQVDGLYM